MKDSNRRHFFKVLVAAGFTIGSDPFSFMLQNICLADDQISKPSSSLVTIFLAGGSPRWMFDLSLFAYENLDELKIGKAKGLITKLNHSNEPNDANPVASDYVKTPSGIIMPNMWQKGSKISTPNGSTELTDLMDNMIMIKGLDMKIDSHPACRYRLFQPVTGVPLIQDYFAEKSKHPMGYINAAEKAGEGLQKIVNQFQAEEAYSFNKQDNDITGFLKNALGILKRDSSRRGRNSKEIFKSTEKALNIIENTIEGIGTNWANLRSKYTNLINDTLSASVIVGVNDKPVKSDGSSKFIFNNDLWVYKNNLTDYVKKIDLVNLADQFAMAEYLILNNHASVVDIISGGVRFGPTSSVNGIQVPFVASDHDIHNMGSMLVMMGYTHFYLALGSCIHELKNVLFNSSSHDTTIMLAGDFGRSPGDSGSDHATAACNVSVWNKKVAKPFVLGNTKTNNNGADIGDANGVTALGRGPIHPEHINSTLCEILGIKSTTPNIPPLVKTTNTSIKPTIELATHNKKVA